MINFFAEFFETVTEAVRKTVREVGGGFQRGMVEKYAEKTRDRLQKATPKSMGPGPHARDAWEIEYEYGAYGGVKSVDIVNSAAAPSDPEKFIVDFLEYGTPPHGPKTAEKLYWEDASGRSWCLDWVEGIEPMGFVREIQAKMERGMPALVRTAFERPIEKHW